METMIRRGDFIDISEFTLTGEDEYFTIGLIGEEIIDETDQEISVAEVEVTGNILTPCFYFVEQYQDTDSLDDFDLECEVQIEEMMIEEELYEDSEDDCQEQELVVGFDLLDALQKQYEKLLINSQNQTYKNEILSSSTSVSGQINAHKNQDFQSTQFQQNLDYAFQTRRDKVQRYLKKRKNRNWNKKISYKCRKQVADSRLRVKGRFITRQQANKLLGMNTNNMTIDLIRTLLQSKFGKQKQSQNDDFGVKIQYIFSQ